MKCVKLDKVALILWLPFTVWWLQIFCVEFLHINYVSGVHIYKDEWDFDIFKAYFDNHISPKMIFIWISSFFKLSPDADLSKIILRLIFMTPTGLLLISVTMSQMWLSWQMSLMLICLKMTLMLIKLKMLFSQYLIPVFTVWKVLTKLVGGKDSCNPTLSLLAEETTRAWAAPQPTASATPGERAAHTKEMQGL